MRHLKNFKLITCFVLFGSLFSSGIQAYDESEIKQTLEKINLNISKLNESKKQLYLNDIELSGRIKNLTENQEYHTKSIENILKEILKNQISTETKLLSILTVIKTDVAFLKEGQTHLVEKFMLFSLPRDCTPKQSNGPYFINLAQKEIKVFCQMDSDGGPWTVIQKRVGPSKANESRQDFFLNWKEYEEGFGDVNEEYWIGLRNIAALTAAGDSELRIEMTDWENNTAYAAYSLFKVGNSSTGYQLNIGNYSGTAEDALEYSNYAKFSTKDKDQDTESENCAESFKGGWWYNYCYYSNLNGIHASIGSNGKVEFGQGIIWRHWKGPFYSLKKVTMMTRRKL